MSGPFKKGKGGGRTEGRIPSSLTSERRFLSLSSSAYSSSLCVFVTCVLAGVGRGTEGGGGGALAAEDGERELDGVAPARREGKECVVCTTSVRSVRAVLCTDREQGGGGRRASACHAAHTPTFSIKGSREKRGGRLERGGKRGYAVGYGGGRGKLYRRRNVPMRFPHFFLYWCVFAFFPSV